MRRSKKRSVLGIGNRRQFFGRAGGAALALTPVALLPACGGGHDDDEPAPTPPGSGTFQHGVASGDPLSDRVILWTRVTPASGSTGSVAVTCTVATDTALANVVAMLSLSADATHDYTVKVDVTGLTPATTYYYRFSAAGASSPIGRTRTLASTTTSLRMAAVSCSNLAEGYFNAYARIAERADLDLVVHLGDYIYEYGTDSSDVRAVEPSFEIVTLADYRQRHAQYKRDPDLQEMHRQHPVIAIWDDHDIASNANATGSQNHTEGVEGTWADRVAAALQAFYEWLPVRMVDATNPRKNYRSFPIGNLVELMMLEERVLARSPQLPGNATLPETFRQRDAFLDPSREMIGSVQQDWLATHLRTSTAQWKFLAQGVMFAQLKLEAQTIAEGGGLFANADQWDGYQPARDRVYEVLKGDASHAAVGNVVVISGDAHSSWAADLTQDPSNTNVAGGGYDAATGAGSRAVEFVGTSVTSPMIIDTHGIAESLLQSVNPHFKYIDLARHGYLLIDANTTRVVGEWWFVDTVTSRDGGQSFATAFQVADGTQHLVPAAQTGARANPPPLAPA
ncbi:MAG TPA: alkaline phosphatase D family protein [Burkholderiaceae bacterium]